MAKIKKSQLVPAASVAMNQVISKPNEAVALRVSSGKLTLLSRKIFNVLIFQAQKLKVPGVNAPTNSDAHQKLFWMPLSDLARTAEYNSKDTKLLKDHLEELRKIGIIVEDEQKWASESLLASVQLYSRDGLKKGVGKKGSPIWFGFAFPPEVESLVVSPKRNFMQMSLYYQTILSSGVSLALYEVCRRYAPDPKDKPFLYTMREPWSWWYGVLSGQPVDPEKLPEYKYFKRDSLKPAVDEINQITDISIELIEHKDGRRVSNIQFRVKKNEQAQINFPPPPVVNGDLVERLISIGISEADSTKLMCSTPEQDINAALDHVIARMKSRNSPPLDSPAAYFRHALKGKYAKPSNSSKQKALAAPKSASEGEQASNKHKALQRKRALDYFGEMEDAEKEALLSDFGQSPSLPPVIRNALAKSGIKSKIVQVEFSAWLAAKLWGNAPVGSDTHIPAG